MRIALLVLALTALPLPALAQAGACDKTRVDAHWANATKAFNAKDKLSATTETNAIIAACGTDPLSYFARVLRAEIAIEAKDGKKAIELLEPVPRPGPKPIGSFSSWLAMHARGLAKDPAGLIKERDALMAAVDAALIKLKGKRVETFTVGDVTVTGYQATYKQGLAERRYYFALVPKAAAFPRAVTISTDSSFDRTLEQGTMYFGDAYFCGGHATIQLIPKLGPDAKTKAPTYAEAREIAHKYAEMQGAEMSKPNFTGQDCEFTKQITPGLD